MISLGLSLWSTTILGSGGASFSIALTGLTDGQAIIGDQASIGYTISPDNGTETVAWGTSAGDSTYGTGANPTDFTAGDGTLLWLTVTDDGESVSSTAPIRYAAGTAPTLASESLTVDDDAANIDASATGANLTFSYAASNLPSGLSINSSTGAITGTPDDVFSGSASIVATDQYGRTLTYSQAFTITLRTQATAASALGPFSFTQDVAIANQDLSADFTTNGNTLTYSIDPTLPSGLSLATNGILSGTPTAVQSASSYTVTGQDEYGRETASAFTIAIVDVPAGAIQERDGDYILDRSGNYIEVRT